VNERFQTAALVPPPPGKHWVQRRFHRYHVDVRLRARLYMDDFLVCALDGQCRELSTGGLGARLSTQLRVGETVLFELAPSVSAYGRVRYVNGFYHGVEFTLLKDAARGHINRLCGALDQPPR